MIRSQYIGFLCLVVVGLSVFYTYSFYDHELFFMHKIPKGSLNIADDFSYTSNGINIIANQTIFQMNLQGKNIFTTGKLNQNQKNQQAFLLIGKSQKTQINSFGDSFFKLKDDIQIFCEKQVIKNISEHNKQIIINGYFQDCSQSHYQIRLQRNKKNSFKVQVQLFSKEYLRSIIRFDDKKDNHYYGLGEQFSYLDLGRNRPYSMFIREKGVGRGEQPQTSIINILHNAGGTYYSSYCPMPIWYSSENIAYLLSQTQSPSLAQYSYSAWMNNQFLVWLNPNSDLSVYSVTILTSQEDNPKQLIRLVAEINGYTPRVPNWVNSGAIVGLQGGTKVVLEKYNFLKSKGVKIRGLWLQDWVSKRMSQGFSRLWWNWQLDKTHYNNWDQMRQDLNKQQVDLLIYVNPMFTDASTKPNVEKNIYKQIKDKNYFVKLNNGQQFETSAFSDFKASLIDFDEKQAKVYYQNLIRKIIKQTGVRGMMVDFSQAYPIINKHSSIEEAMRYHNRYSVIYHQAVRQVLDQFQEQQIYTFTRAGFAGAPKYAQSLWAGDQNMNFKRNTGIKSCLIAMLSSGLGGYSSTHCDIGGYTYFNFFGISQRTQLLMSRWMQLAAFSPVFRTHQGNSPQNTLQVFSTDKLAQQFAFYSQIFTILSEYRRNQWEKSQQLLLPLVRPLFVQLGFNDQQILKIDDQFYLGQDIIVSPIITSSNYRQYYLPKGQWINIWTKQQITQNEGKLQKYSGSLLPVFIKTSSDFAKSIPQKINALKQSYFKNIGLNQSQTHNPDL